mgnify:CR=1 FL=1
MSTRANIRLITFCLFLILAMLTVSATLIYSAGFQNLESYMTIGFEAGKVTLNFGNNAGSNINSSTCKVVYNDDKSKFKITGITPTISNGSVTNLSALTNSAGAEFYYFVTNSSVLNTTGYTDPGTTYYISGLGTDANPAVESWYDVPSDKMTIYATFMVPTFTSLPEKVTDLTEYSIFSHRITLFYSYEYMGKAGATNLSVAVIPNTITELSGTSSSTTKSISKKDKDRLNMAVAEPTMDPYYESIFYCSGLDKVILPNSFKSLYGFSYCGLREIIIPSSVTSIGKNAFYTCSYLNSVIFEDKNSTWTVNSNTIIVTNPTQNATYLKSTYVDYEWTKNS